VVASALRVPSSVDRCFQAVGTLSPTLQRGNDRAVFGLLQRILKPYAYHQSVKGQTPEKQCDRLTSCTYTSDIHALKHIISQSKVNTKETERSFHLMHARIRRRSSSACGWLGTTCKPHASYNAFLRCCFEDSLVTSI